MTGLLQFAVTATVGSDTVAEGIIVLSEAQSLDVSQISVSV